jgi:hypothetical protein
MMLHRQIRSSLQFDVFYATRQGQNSLAGHVCRCLALDGQVPEGNKEHGRGKVEVAVKS